MSAFKKALAQHENDPRGRRWIFVSYDQLTADVGPLSRENPRDVGIVLVECPQKASRRPYHVQKLALLLSSLRHFAVEQAARGVAVKHVVADSYVAALSALSNLGSISMMRAAERELRNELAPLVERGSLTILPHEGWLTKPDDFQGIAASTNGGKARMDAFYRRVRTRLGILMEDGKPIGGRFSFDTENRKPWRGDPLAPRQPTFEPDEITNEVCDLVRDHFARHPGTLHPEMIPASRADVERVWSFAKSECLPEFGPYEDAMSSRERTLFHTRISPLLNLLRLPAKRVIDDVLKLDLPLPSQEGFVRQILGWREYMHHVHEATDGFRVVFGNRQPCASAPGDGGYETWAKEAWNARDDSRDGHDAKQTGGDGGSRASFLSSHEPLPPAYWGEPSGLRCLDEVVRAVWDEGYSHHITRLMVLSNLAMLLDVEPRELTDWFWVAYIDAYDWVVEPNVHAMGTFGVGDRFTTKPYIAGAAYIHKMSDFCEGCAFNPKTTCPITPMYWAFLGRHREALKNVERLKLPLAAEAKRSASQKEEAAATFERVRKTLAGGARLEP